VARGWARDATGTVMAVPPKRRRQPATGSEVTGIMTVGHWQADNDAETGRDSDSARAGWGAVEGPAAIVAPPPDRTASARKASTMLIVRKK
jgi:hypothetical protein